MSARASRAPDDDGLLAFVRSMPPAYASCFSRDEIREHCAMVLARGSAVAHVALWRAFPDAVACVIADDAPGLLSHIATALVTHRLDVNAAQIFVRDTVGGKQEAVDFFWLRRSSTVGTAPIRARDVAAVGRTLTEILLAQRHSTNPPPPSGDTPTEALGLEPRAFFDVRALRRGEYVLVVEALDGPGLLLAISRALFKRGLQTLASEVHTSDGIAHDRFTLAAPDGPLTPEGLADVQRAVLKALRELRTR